MTTPAPSNPASNVAVAQAAADAARAVHGVLDLDAGTVGEFATYGVQSRVPGVRATASPASVSLRLVVQYGLVIGPLADEVRDRVQRVLASLVDGSVTVDVHVADVRTHSSTPQLTATTAPAQGVVGQEAPWPS